MILNGLLSLSIANIISVSYTHLDEAEQEADPTWDQELPDDITIPEHKRKARRTHACLLYTSRCV